MASLVSYDYENGSDGANMTSALITPLTVSASAAGTFSSTHKYRGTLGGHYNVGASSTYVQAYALGTPSVTVGWRIYGWMAAYPSANASILSFLKSGSRIGTVRINLDGTVSVRNNADVTVATSATLLGTSVFWRLEVLITAGTSIAARLFVAGNVNGSTPDESITGATGGTNIDTVRQGLTASGPAFEYYVDDMAIDDTTWPGPVIVPVSANFNYVAPSYKTQWGTSNLFAAPTGTGDLGSETFEKGTDGANITSSLLDLMTTSSSASTATFSSAHTARGSLSCHIAVSAANKTLSFTPLVSEALMFARFYGYYNALPATNFVISSWTLAGTKVGGVRINVDGTVTIQNGSTAVATSATVLPAGSLWRLEIKMQPGTEIRARLFVGANVEGATQDQEISGALSGTLIDQANFGSPASSTQDFYMDSFAFNDTAFPGPAPAAGTGSSGNFAFISPQYKLQTPAVAVGNDGQFTWVSPQYQLDGTPDQLWVGQQSPTAVSAAFAWATVSYATKVVVLPTFTGSVVVTPPPTELPLPPGIVADGEYLLTLTHPEYAVTLISGAAMKQNDLEPDVVAKLSDRNAGTAVDLSLADSATFVMADAKTGAVKVSAPASITDPVNGEITYQWTAGDTDTVSRYRVEFVVTWPGARPQTFPTIGTADLVVSADLS